MAVSDKISLNIKFLDNTESTFSVQGKSTGSALLQGVIRDMNLIEADYFGLSFQDKHGNDNFLNPSKKIKLQLPNANNQALKFVVKFFPPDPGQLHEEFTKYLFVLQIRNDIEHEKLICNEETLATLIAYFVQADFGDWNEEDCSDSSYLKNVKIWPKGYSFDNRASKIVELHKSFLGLSPANAESQILSIACKLELYGIRKHLAHDHENSEIYLAVTHEGVIVLQGNSKINTFNWSRVRKLSFKKKRFLIKLKPETNSENLHGNVIVFLMESRDACKSFWRECLEHHAFFRMDTRPEPMVQPRLLKRGSTFRYSGKTQRQLTEFVRNNPLRRTDFVRVSRRKNLSLRSANSTKTTPTYSTTASNKILEMQPRVSKQEISDNTEEKNMKSQASKQITNISSEVSQPWEIDSGNLHSTAVSATPKEDHEEQSEPASEKADEETAESEKSGKDSSSSLLHSGGATVISEEMTSANEVLPQSPPSVLNSSPSAVISTSDLKSTSSLLDPKAIASQIYFIVKELFMTERTCIKDLEVINTCFKSSLNNDAGPRLIPQNIANQLFGGTDSLLAIHRQFLLELENKLKSGEGGGDWDVEDGGVDKLILNHILMLSKYLDSLENAESLIGDLEELASTDIKFESAYREFELQNVCYLPFSSFLLKPMQRIIHYKIIIENLLHTYAGSNKSELNEALCEIDKLQSTISSRLDRAYNLQKLAQLRRDLIGADNILISKREFIREGSLHKLSRKGFQQRLFFLFSDCLLYTSKGVTSTNQFKVHAELPLTGMIIEVNEGESAVPNCFSLVIGEKSVILAASNAEELNKWLEDLSRAISAANTDGHAYQSPLSSEKGSSGRLSSGFSSDDGEDSRRSSMDVPKLLLQQRSNATMHVCWHRNTSVGQSDHLRSLQNQMSGYLLRKFKNSDGWQKLWVVFSNFCLFFYKSYQDEEPLASLPLLGYSISHPDDEDGINKDSVFKLKYKTHVYFFRAESQYTFNRWYQVICSITVAPSSSRLFSRSVA